MTRRPAPAPMRQGPDRTRVVAIAVVAVLVVAFVVAVVFVLTRGGGDSTAAGGSPSPTATGTQTPSVVQPDGGIAIGAQGVPVADVAADATTVDVYFDYMCPWCGRFERSNAATLDAVRDEGVVVRYHVLSFLDRASQGSGYSTRAATASLNIATDDPAHWLAFHEALFTNEPEEGTTGLTDEKLAEQARAVGVSDAAVANMTNPRYSEWLKKNTETAFTKIDSTPTVMIDGQTWTGDWQTDGALRSAIDQAVAAAKG